MIERRLIAGGEPRPLVVFDPRGGDRDPARAGDAGRRLPLRASSPARAAATCCCPGSGGRSRSTRAALLARGARPDRGLRSALGAALPRGRLGGGGALGDAPAAPSPPPCGGCGPGASWSRRAARGGPPPSGSRAASPIRWPGERAPRRQEGGGVSALARDRSRRVELACFAALAALVDGAVGEPGRASAGGTGASSPSLLATGAGALLAAIARLEPRGARWALAAAATLAALLAGMVVVGLPARLLLPGHWDELGDNVSRSLNGVGDVPIPYSGADDLDPAGDPAGGPAARRPRRLRRLLADPSPGRRARSRALVLLVGLYLVAVAWAEPVAPARRRRAPAACWSAPGSGCRASRPPGAPLGGAIAVGAAALVALPAAAALDTGRGLLDYRHWGLLSANGQSFRWDQTYGPARLAAEGDPAARRSRASTRTTGRRPTSNTFDGIRWVRSSVAGGPARPRRAAQVPPEGGAAPSRPGVRRPDQLRRPRAEQRLRDRRRARSWRCAAPRPGRPRTRSGR